MSKSTGALAQTVAALTGRARALGLTDTAWANRAGVWKETLSRLRSRETCDFETLRSLAHAVGARLGVLEMPAPDSTPDGHFPARVDGPGGAPSSRRGRGCGVRPLADAQSLATDALPVAPRCPSRTCGLIETRDRSTWRRFARSCIA